MIRALQAIVFDFDGVIADSERLHLLVLSGSARAAAACSSPTTAYYGEYLGYDDVAVFRHYAVNHGLGVGRRRRWRG